MAARPQFLDTPQPGVISDVVRFAMMAWDRVQTLDVGSIGLMSTAPREGVTTLTCLLGQVLASHRGLRVLLLDGNPHHPVLADVAGVTCPQGWHDAVERSPEALAMPTAWPNVAVCAYGPAAPHEQHLDGTGFEEFLQRCTAAYDVVLLDCAPLAYMGEALHFGRRVDATMLVVQADRLNRETLAQSCTTLEHLGPHFLGAILNQLHHLVSDLVYREG